MEMKETETKTDTPKLGSSPLFCAFSRLLFGVSHFNPSEDNGNGDADGCWMEMEVMCEGTCFEVSSRIGIKMLSLK